MFKMKNFQGSNLLPKHWKLPLTAFIDGSFTANTGKNMFPINFAAMKQLIGLFQESDDSEVNMAIESSIRAQLEWKTFSPAKKSQVLRNIADKLKERNDEIASLETLDTSRVIAETKVVDVVSAYDAFYYFSGIAATLSGQHIQLSPKNYIYTIPEPLGVVAGIGAWNYPLQGMSWKVAPALAAGNSIVFKPSEETILSALVLAEIVSDSGAPKGLLNVVLGSAKVGSFLSTSPDVAKVSFTGSIQTGASIIHKAAESDLERVNSLSDRDLNSFSNDRASLKKITMELGGKSPLIVFEDADIDEAVSATLMANFYSNGQVCSNGTRVFIHENIKQVFTKKLVERTEKLSLGFPFDVRAEISSLISPQHLEKVKKYIAAGILEGAKLLTGGKSYDKIDFQDEILEGSYCEPTIFDNCNDEMTIVREEIFGPVACLLTFSNFDEVIARANDTPFGLAGGVFTKDLKKAHVAVQQINAGIIYINNYNLAPVEMPWGGYKLSGKGRENGFDAVKNYLQIKSVYTELSCVDCPYE